MEDLSKLESNGKCVDDREYEVVLEGVLTRMTTSAGKDTSTATPGTSLHFIHNASSNLSEQMCRDSQNEEAIVQSSMCLEK